MIDSVAADNHSDHDSNNRLDAWNFSTVFKSESFASVADEASEALKDAWRTAKDVKEFASEYPVTSALGTVAAGVALFGAVRLGMFNKLGIPETAGNIEKLLHLTKVANVDAIRSTGKIGGQWGIFTLDSAKIPHSSFVKIVKTLVPGDLSGSVSVTGDLIKNFHAPLPVGPFSLARNMTGLRNSWLGSVDLRNHQFITNEIFKDGTFRAASSAEIRRFKSHQFILDYAIDSQLWTIGSLSALRYELNK